jgi:hypothetical protein
MKVTVINIASAGSAPLRIVVKESAYDIAERTTDVVLLHKIKSDSPIWVNKHRITTMQETEEEDL